MLRRLIFSTLVAMGAVTGVQAQEATSLPPAVEQSPEMINYLHQRQWVRLNEEGVVAGKLSVLTADGLTESRVGAQMMVTSGGKVVAETTTGTDGSFEFADLQPGTYALQTRGDYTLAALALHVLPSDSTHLTNDLEVYASVIAADRATELLAGDLVPAELESSGDTYYRFHTKDPLAGQREFNNSHRVVLRDGSLIGRVSRPGWTYAEQDLRGTVAQVVREGVVVGKAAVDRDGFYQVDNLQPGVYDLFVSGDDGFAVLSFEAVSANEPVAQGDKQVRFVTTQSGLVTDTLSTEMIQQGEFGACFDCGGMTAGVEPCVDCGMDPGLGMYGGGYAGGFGGGGGGFGGGGGGGFGGLGGLGGLLGAAGLAVGIAALADDDDPDFATPVAP